ncbi:MAG: HEAT repeat domain-containing protein [Proteobacteria bacterium]|nr:HEAT repeat domain-containing protein [Pseudomonadota bacterium]MBU1612274.1 HEAT repeat domain-containing protein [Pseudomonadota bacterium]
MANTDFLKGLLGDNKEELREAAFLAGDARSVDAVPLLAELLKDSNLGVQEAADAALRRIGGRETVEAVLPLLRSDSAPTRNLSMDILRQVGGEHMDALVGLVHDDDADIRIFASDILGSTGSNRALKSLCDMLLKDPEVNVRYQAAVSLGILGMPEAAACLNKAMKDEEWVQYSVIEALAKLKQSSSVDALVKAMDHSSDLVGSMIIDALGAMGNVKAVKVLLDRMESSPAALRNKIVKAVIDILGGKSLALLSDNEREHLRMYMLHALDDDEVETQDAAILGLGYIGGEKASASILGLATNLDPDRDQDRLAIIFDSLARIGMTPALTKALESGEWKMARCAVYTLGLIGGPDVSQVMVDAFWDKDLEMQREIARTLGKIADETAKKFFLFVLDRHQDGKVLKSALRFLGGKLSGKEAGETLFKLLSHEYDDVKEAALDACIAIGGATMIDRFKDMAASKDPIDRLMSAYALGRMNGLDHLDFLKNALEDEEPDIRKVALESVSLMCQASEKALELVVSRLNDENREVRIAVVEVMGNCYSDNVLPYLVEALNDQEDWVKIRALEALASLRPPDVVSHLAPLLETPNTLVAIKAIEAIGSIGGAAAFKVLLNASHGEEQELAQAAEVAMEKLQQTEAGEE